MADNTTSVIAALKIRMDAEVGLEEGRNGWQERLGLNPLAGLAAGELTIPSIMVPI
jgi:hypothetical protein